MPQLSISSNGNVCGVPASTKLQGLRTTIAFGKQPLRYHTWLSGARSI